MQVSVCCSYVFFIGSQFDRIVCHYTGGSIDDDGVITCDNPAEDSCYCGHDKMYMMLLTIPALPIGWIETYTVLSYFSMFGIGLAIIGMLIMFGILGNKIVTDQESPGEVKVFDPF